MSEVYTNNESTNMENKLRENGETTKERTVLLYSEQSKIINSFLKLSKQVSKDSVVSVEVSEELEPSEEKRDTEDVEIDEGEDSDAEDLYDDDGGFESGDSDETEFTIQAPIRTEREDHRTVQYIHHRPAPETTSFLSIVSQKLSEGREEAEIVSHLEGFIQKMQPLPNKQSILHKLICQPEKSGELEGVHLLTFCAVTDMEKLTVLMVKVILHQCFPTPGHALPYLRMQDEEGNTILHNIVLYHNKASVHTLKSLLSFRYKTSTDLVFVFDPMILNNLGQHPIHLAMDKPDFRKPIFDIFNALNMGILKLADNCGNNLLHYLVINAERIIADQDSLATASEHVLQYLHSLLNYADIRDCLPKLNHDGLNAKWLLDARTDLDAEVKSALQEELERAVLGLDMPGSPDSGYDAAGSPDVFTWTCTSMNDPNCTASFATDEEVKEHMLKVHCEDGSGMLVDDAALDFKNFDAFF